MEKPPSDRFVSYAIDYGVTGSKGWAELSTARQDEYLLACFAGEAVRAAAEKRLGLYDRAAGSLAQHLLGVYQQYDINEGIAHYQPPTPRVSAGVLERRRRVLAGTKLGKRLDAALDRAEGRQVAHADDELTFYSVALAAKGMDVLDESCSRDSGWMVPHSFIHWNNFEALDRLHDQHTSTRWREDQEADFKRMLNEDSAQHTANQAVAPPAPSAEPAHMAPSQGALPSAASGWVYLPAALAACMLGVALLDSHPSWFYSALRLVVCGSLVWLAVRAMSTAMVNWSIALGIGAVVYNPLAPFHLGRSAWGPVNTVTIIALVVFCALLWRRERLNP